MTSLNRFKRKERIGVVVGDKMDKTATVRVDRVYHHKIYTRTMKASKKYKVHDEKDEAKLGDVVRIVETRPISKTKRWRLVEIIKKA